MESYSVCSLSIMSSRFIYDVACGRTSFSFNAESYSIICMCYSLLIYSSIHGHLGCPYILVTMDSASMNIRVQISLQDPAFKSFECAPRVRISYHTISIFSILSNHHTVFIMVAQLSRISVSPHHCQHLLFSLLN